MGEKILEVWSPRESLYREKEGFFSVSAIQDFSSRVLG